MNARLSSIAVAVTLAAALTGTPAHATVIDMDLVIDAVTEARQLTVDHRAATGRADNLAAAFPSLADDVRGTVDRTYEQRAIVAAEAVDTAAITLVAQLTQGDEAAAATLGAWFEQLLPTDDLPAPQQLLAQARETAPELLLNQPGVVAVGGVVCPVAGGVSFVNDWGFPRSGGRTHKGNDLFGAEGTPLVAVRDAVVTKVDPTDTYGAGGSDLGGITTWIADDNGDHWYYAHLLALAPGLHVGQRVLAGEVIGYLGKTGNARGTPPHLHIQRHPGNGPPTNPFPSLRPACYGR
jgi:peptidoglycan LD-endopeptidase LytH